MSNLNHHVLAAYYNDARLNILSCLNDIREKNGQKPIHDEAEILTAFSTLALTTTTPERQRDLIKHLRNRFHFVDVLIDTEIQKNKPKDVATPIPAKYDSNLKWLFKLINDLRNTTVHPVDHELMLDRRLHKRLFFILNKIYDGSLRTVKTRFDLETSAIEPLLRCDRKGRAKTPDCFSFALCTDPKNLKDDAALRQSQVLHDFGHVLLCSLFLDKSQSAELISYFWRAGCAIGCTDLQKTIIKELISVYRIRLPIQRLKSDDTPTAVTLDTLSELSRCPRELLETLSPKDQKRFRGNLTSMSASDTEDDEPSYLFARGHQDRFIPLMMHFLDFDPDSKLRFAIDFGQFYYNVRLKPSDRFTDAQSRVRRLGHKIVGYDRLTDFETIEKPKEWQELEKNYTDFIGQQETITNRASAVIEHLPPYIVETYPHYHYYDDKIGFRLAKTEEPAAYPDLALKGWEQKKCLDPIPGKKMEPEFWIGPAQLVHLGFYAYLQKQTQTDYPRLDILLKQYRGGMTKLLIALANGNPELPGEPFSDERRQQAQQWLDSFFNHRNSQNFSVMLADLPQVLSQYLIGSGHLPVSKDEIERRAKHLLNETEQKQEQIDKLLQQPVKRGKKGFRPIKCGHIGDFLADDLMRFQPVDRSKKDGGKINSQHYQILQAALAYYGAHIDEPPKIVDLLRDAGLLAGDFAHPFLPALNLEKKPDRFSGLLSFYKAYLQARKQFLEDFLKNIKPQTAPPNWLRLKQHSSLDSWLEGFKDEDTGKIAIDTEQRLKQPLPVPKNMLYQPLLTIVAEAVGISPETLHKEGVQSFTRQGQSTEVRPAISWLIRRYLEHKNDGAQAMYQYPRRHDLFDAYLDKRTPKQRFHEQRQHYLAEQQRKDYLVEIRSVINTPENDPNDTEKKEKLTKQLKYYKRQEKQIRHCATKDMLLYLFAKNHLHTLQLSGTESSPTWPLNNIENTLLNTAIHYQLAVPKTDKILFHPECKIRNLGELRLLVRDKRLPSLMNYYPQHEKIINQAEISAELVSYRRAKVKAMALVHKLENEIMQNCETIEKNSVPAEFKPEFGEGRHGEFLYALYQLSKTENRQNQPDSFDMSRFNKARLLRNALSHNEYPETCAFAHVAQSVNLDKIPENPAKHRKIAERLLAEMERLYEPWLTFLKQSIKEH